MPDITMCANKDCVVKERCYRYMAIPSHYQSVAIFQPNKNDLCDYFWSITNERTRTEDEANEFNSSYLSQREGDIS